MVVVLDPLEFVICQSYYLIYQTFLNLLVRTCLSDNTTHHIDLVEDAFHMKYTSAIKSSTWQVLIYSLLAYLAYDSLLYVFGGNYAEVLLHSQI